MVHDKNFGGSWRDHGNQRGGFKRGGSRGGHQGGRGGGRDREDGGSSRDRYDGAGKGRGSRPKSVSEMLAEAEKMAGGRPRRELQPTPTTSAQRTPGKRSASDTGESSKNKRPRNDGETTVRMKELIAAEKKRFPAGVPLFVFKSEDERHPIQNLLWLEVEKVARCAIIRTCEVEDITGDLVDVAFCGYAKERMCGVVFAVSEMAAINWIKVIGLINLEGRKFRAWRPEECNEIIVETWISRNYEEFSRSKWMRSMCQLGKLKATFRLGDDGEPVTDDYTIINEIDPRDRPGAPRQCRFIATQPFWDQIAAANGVINLLGMPLKFKRIDKIDEDPDATLADITMSKLDISSSSGDEDGDDEMKGKSKTPQKPAVPILGLSRNVKKETPVITLPGDTASTSSSVLVFSSGTSTPGGIEIMEEFPPAAKTEFVDASAVAAGIALARANLPATNTPTASPKRQRPASGESSSSKGPSKQPKTSGLVRDVLQEVLNNSGLASLEETINAPLESEDESAKKEKERKNSGRGGKKSSRGRGK